MASEDDDLRTVLCQSSREDLKTNTDSAASLLIMLLACAGPVYIIIDGLDEIDELERGKLMRHLLTLATDSENTKILVSSRPEDDIAKSLDEKAIQIRIDHRNAGSIQSFINSHTQTWYQERGFSLEAQTEISSLLAPLAAKSKGFCALMSAG